MYGILYAYTPESFPAPHRGTGDALCSALNRIGGFIAPLIKIATTPKTGSVSANTANGCVFLPSTSCFEGLTLHYRWVVPSSYLRPYS